MNYIDGDIIKQITTSELNNLSGITSNIQNQLNDKLNKPTNLTTLNNLVVFDTENNIKDNNLSIITDTNMTNTSNDKIPSSLAIKNYIDNKIYNLQNNVAVGGGINYYFTNNNHPIIPNYEYINNYPDNTGQDTKSIIVRNNNLLLSTYITNNLNRTILNRGIFQFYFYASVSDIDNYSYIKVEIFKRSSSGTETLIIDNIKSNDINVVYPNNNVYICEATIQNDISLSSTDELVFKIYGGTEVSNKDITIYFYHGGNTNSYIVTPFVSKHNELIGLNEGDYKHLTNQQFINATSIATASNSGILDTTLYNTFNNKLNKPTNSTTLNNLVVFDTDKNIKDNGLSIITDTSMANSNNNLIPSSLAIKTYIDNKINQLNTPLIIELYSKANRDIYHLNKLINDNTYRAGNGSNVYWDSVGYNIKSTVAGYYQFHMTLRCVENNFLNVAVVVDNQVYRNLLHLYETYDPPYPFSHTMQISNLIYMQANSTLNFINNDSGGLSPFQMNILLVTFYLVSAQTIS